MAYCSAQMEAILEQLEQYKSGRENLRNIKQFREMLMEAVSHGKLTSEGISQLEAAREELGIREPDVCGLKLDIYLAAFSAAKKHGFSAADAKDLRRIQHYLGLEDS